MKRICTAMLGTGLLLTGCQKAKLDEEVDRLCKIDGGIRVYETVKLSKEDFDDRGIVFPQYATLPGDKGRYGDAFFSSWEVRTIVAGNPELIRSHLKLIRRSDGKILGEQIVYARRGGDLPSPFHPSAHSCSPAGESPDLVQRIFVKEP